LRSQAAYHVSPSLRAPVSVYVIPFPVHI
jgi:hypothetical protein